MKKTIILISLFFFLLFISSIAKSSFGIVPRELSVTMTDEFIQGNTLKSITITNSNNYEINITWYLDHPSSDMIRSNKTTIPDLSWIDVKPKWEAIPTQSNTKFYVYLNIPEEQENLKQKWESWIVFKQHDQQFINIENAVRFYIDTPTEMTIDNNQDSDAQSKAIDNQFKISVLDITVTAIVIALFIISILYLKKKKI
jgi:hypothetical protein